MGHLVAILQKRKRSRRLEMEIWQEVRMISSTDIDGNLLYPGKWILTWVKMPFMPWVLFDLKPLGGK
jgi:hypothetical protein